MLLVFRKIARFVASPSGILIALGLLAVASATAVNSAEVSFWLGVVGAMAAVVGIARRFIRSEELRKCSHQAEKQLRGGGGEG